MWGGVGRHHVFSLQHDGVAACLAAEVSESTAASELTYIETRALRMRGVESPWLLQRAIWERPRSPSTRACSRSRRRCSGSCARIPTLRVGRVTSRGRKPAGTRARRNAITAQLSSYYYILRYYSHYYNWDKMRTDTTQRPLEKRAEHTVRGRTKAHGHR